MTKKLDNLLPRNARLAIHFLDTSKRPAEIACGHAVKTTFTADKTAITCKDCWLLAHPQPPRY